MSLYHGGTLRYLFLQSGTLKQNSVASIVVKEVLKILYINQRILSVNFGSGGTGFTTLF